MNTERIIIACQITLLIAKLYNAVNWSWWIILLPLYAPILFILAKGYIKILIKKI